MLLMIVTIIGEFIMYKDMRLAYNVVMILPLIFNLIFFGFIFIGANKGEKQ